MVRGVPAAGIGDDKAETSPVEPTRNAADSSRPHKSGWEMPPAGVGRLPLELVRDFVFKNQSPSKVGEHFGFGVRYRFVTGQGADQEASLAPTFAVWREVFPVQEEPLDEPPAVIDRLAFSRVAYTFDREQALVYVEYNRGNGSGAGFAVWLTQSGKRWGIFDSELVWAARPHVP